MKFCDPPGKALVGQFGAEKARFLGFLSLRLMSAFSAVLRRSQRALPCRVCPMWGKLP